MNLNPTTKSNRLNQPEDPYDTPAWLAFYEQNPGFRRSVGAKGVNDDDDANTGDDDDENTNDDDDDTDDKSKKSGADDNKDGKPSDKEAELLKDVMKQKEARRAAEARAKELEEQYGDIDLEEYKRIKAEQAEAAETAKKAEEQRLLDAGEFDKVKEQMIAQHEEALEAERAKAAETAEQLAKANKVIEELTVGSDFSSSKFISDETVFTPRKARALYGAHFDVEDGKVVGYDKPRGEEGRTRLVDSSGNPASFDVAMKRIIESDPDKEDILLASITPGAGSDSGGEKKKETAPQSSRDKISSGIVDLMKNPGKADDGNFKF